MEEMEILGSRREIFNFFGVDAKFRSGFIDEIKKFFPVWVSFGHLIFLFEL